MYIVLLLVAALLLAYYVKPADKHSYHMAILAIFGIGFFSIWRFTAYYLDLFHPGGETKTISFFFLMLSIVALSFSPWVTNIKRRAATVLVVLFAVCVAPTFVLENNIKNSIAESGGYFSQAKLVFSKSASTSTLVSFRDQAGGFNIDIPSHWRQLQHPTGMAYFVWQQDAKKIAELRPRCFHNVNTSIAEIINNIIQWDQSQAMRAEKHCSKDKDSYICFVRSTGEVSAPIKEKWRWLQMDKYQQQNIELDVLFYDIQDQSRREAEAILQSIKLQPLPSPLPLCASTVDWF